MLRIPALIVCVTTMSFSGACREDDTPRTTSKEPSSRSSPSEAPPAPQWTLTHIAVDHFKPAAAAITCDGGFGPTGSMKCGPSNLGAEISWKFLRRIGDADEYEVTIVTRLQEDSAFKLGATRTKITTVIYKGTKLVIFEDDRKRVTLYPDTVRSGTASGEATETE